MARRKKAAKSLTKGPTIHQVLAQFLSDQQARLAPKTFERYRTIIELLTHCLDDYGMPTDGVRADTLDFCGTYGPADILPNIGQFLGYFMVRKVMAGDDTRKAAGTVTNKLAKWLTANGYVEADSGAEAAEASAERGRDLVKAGKLQRLLEKLAEGSEAGQDDDHEGHFRVIRVEPGKLWLEDDMDGEELGALIVPDTVTTICRTGLAFSGVLGTRRGKLKLIELWNVYP